MMHVVRTALGGPIAAAAALVTIAIMRPLLLLEVSGFCREVTTSIILTFCFDKKQCALVLGGCSKRETSALQSTTGPNHSMIWMVFAILGSRKNHSDRILDLHRRLCLKSQCLGPI